MGLFFLWSVCIALSFGQKENNRPIVGIVTQASEWRWPNQQDSYIAASYVKFVESSGARVVPIWYDGSQDYLQRMASQINGVLFPGGGQYLDHSTLLNTAKFFLNHAQTSQDWWPVFGHCQGFEVLLMAITGLDRDSCMTNNTLYKAENISLPISLTLDPKQTRWFQNVEDSVLKTLTTENSTVNNHMWSITPDMFQKLQGTGLSNYRILSTTTSPMGKVFVSQFEAINFPLYAMQFHAEKPIFEWPNENINHSSSVVAASLYFSRFVGIEARKNSRSFASKSEETAALIYNYSPTISISFSTFDQVYFFNPSNKK